MATSLVRSLARPCAGWLLGSFVRSFVISFVRSLVLSFDRFFVLSFFFLSFFRSFVISFSISFFLPFFLSCSLSLSFFFLSFLIRPSSHSFFFLLSFLRSPFVLPSSIGSLSRSLDGECLRNAYGELTESLRKTSSYLSKPCFLFGHPPQQLTACLTQDCHAQFLTPAYGEPYGPLRQVLCLRRLKAHLTDPYGFPSASSFFTMSLLTAAYGAPYGPLRFSQR